MPSFINGETKFPQLLRNYLEAQRATVGLPLAASLPFESFQGAVIGLASGLATTDVITASTPHGLSVGNAVNLPTLTGGAGLTALTTTYYVQSIPSLTTLKLAATLGGAAVDFTTNITAGEIRTLRELKRPYVGFIAAGFTSPHPLLQRIVVECELHLNTEDTPPSTEETWIAAIRAVLSDKAALDTWLAALSSADRTGWRLTGLRLTEAAIEGSDKSKHIRTRRTSLALRCQSTETAGF